MNVKRYLLAALVAFVSVNIFQWVYHGVLLADAYEATADLWRAKPTGGGMTEHCYVMMVSQALFVLIAGFLFLQKYEGKGLAEGVRFGAYIGLLLAAIDLGIYAYMPIEFTLVTAWMLSSLVTGVLTGVSFALVYKKKTGGKKK